MEAEASIAEPKVQLPPARKRESAQLPIGVHSASLAVLAVLACIWALRWAGPVIIPVLLGLMCSYALTPVVDRLQGWHVPRALGAATLLLAIAGGLGTMAYSLSDDATALIESLPEAAQKLQRSVRSSHGTDDNPIVKVQRAAQKIEQAAQTTAAVVPPPPPAPSANAVPRVQIDPPRFTITSYLWNGTLGLVGLVGQGIVVLFVTFFLLVSGDAFRRKLVSIAGPHLSHKKVTVQVLDEVNVQIRRYLQVQVFTSVLVGVLTWLALLGFGLQRAAVWGIVVALLNLVPYVGTLITTGAVVLAAFLQFGAPGVALGIGGVLLAIHVLEASLLTPWLAGRASRMSPLVIFVGVLAFGWLWGIWGLLLGAPLLMATKVVCDRVQGLQAVGELLGA